MRLSRRQLMAAATAALVQPGVSRAASQVVQVNLPASPTAFVPAEVRVRVGDTVEWTSESIVLHTVTCDPAKVEDKSHVSLPDGAVPFDSGDINLDGTWRHVFTVPGAYRYVCVYHQDMGMVGTVIVSA